MFETLKYRKVLKSIIETTQLQKREKVLKDENIIHVLVYDLLFGKGISDKGPHPVSVLPSRYSYSSDYNISTLPTLRCANNL